MFRIDNGKAREYIGHKFNNGMGLGPVLSIKIKTFYKEKEIP